MIVRIPSPKLRKLYSNVLLVHWQQLADLKDGLLLDV